MRKVFLENLPIVTRGKGIDWKNCTGYIIKFVYDGIEGELEIISYDKEHQNLLIRYINTDIITPMNTSQLINCGFVKLLGKRTNEFKIEIGTYYKDDKRDIVITDRKHIKEKNGRTCKMYKYKCNKCGFECGEHYKDGDFKEEHWISEYNLLKGNGCACCCNPSVILVQGINDIPTTAPWMIKYFVGGYEEAKLYTKSSGQKIYPVCPDCGRIKNKKMRMAEIYNRKSISCSCSDNITYPNKFMFGLLEQLNIEFTNEHSPKWIHGKVYDFYVSPKNIIIEMDGELGHGKRTHSKSKKTAKETKADDDYKDLMADKHGIKVIRINCDESDLEYIKNNILKSELIDYFNFDNIDWLKVEEFALKNRVKEVCEFKRDNPDMTTFEISKILKLCRNTIRNYLIKGNAIWDWCNYDPKKELLKSVCKAQKSNNKIVEIFKDNISLGIFQSVKELSEKSEDLFGIKLLRSNISAVCTGIVKTHKGFTFRYVEKLNNEQN